MSTIDRPHHLAALLAVLDAARATLVPCSMTHYTSSIVGPQPCGRPALYTLGSPNVTVCKLHASAHNGRHDLWPMEKQTKLVAAIAAYDGIEGALPDLTEAEELGPEPDELEAGGA